jgi:hypothetical protein
VLPAGATQTVRASVRELQRTAGNAAVRRIAGEPLDAGVRGDMEQHLGTDLGHVRVHADTDAAARADQLGAAAFARRADVAFAAGMYRPDTPAGRVVLAHELAHVIQQTRNTGSPALGTADLEAEADAAAAHGEPVLGSAPPGSTQGVPAGTHDDVLPVARFSPAPGLFVDRTEHSLSISGAMELYGPEANAARAASIEQSINSTWNRAFSDGYTVTCAVTVTYRPPGSSAGHAAQIEAAKTTGPSHALLGEITLNANEPLAFTWTPAHEFGHVIGLKDRYSESIVSSIKGTFGGTRTSTPQPGYAGNLMAAQHGTLESKNVADVASETNPSAAWVNDDNEVRDWVNAHPPSDIASLPTASKLAAIDTLMGGWISDADVAAIVQICGSVTSKTEAASMRAGVKVSEMKNHGQRILVKLALDKMPE